MFHNTYMFGGSETESLVTNFYQYVKLFFYYKGDICPSDLFYRNIYMHFLM